MKLRSLMYRMVVVVLGSLLASCAREEPTVPGNNAPGPVSAYLAQTGAAQPIDLPALDVDLPDAPPAWWTNDDALVRAIAGSGGRAFVGFKEATVLPLALSGRSVRHPFKTGRLLRQGTRPALSADAVRRGLANLERRGVRIVQYYEQLGIALIEIDPANAPLVRADSTLDWIEPIPGPGTPSLIWRNNPVATWSGLLVSQVTPWGVTMVGAPAAWPTTRGENTKLLLIDSGYGPIHPDMPAPGPGGVTCMPSSCEDFGEGHGTAVAGTVLAQDNSVGTVGVAPGVNPGNVKVYEICSVPGGGGEIQDPLFSSTAGLNCFSEWLVDGLNWAVANLGARNVINMSVGWSIGSTTMATAVASVWLDGQLLIAAAGNVQGGPAVATKYPAAYSQVLAVSGVGESMTLAHTSTCRAGFGSVHGSHVALGAPFETFAVKTPQTYDTACGTSISAPYVAGVAALVWSHWGFSNQGLREHLLVTALDRPPTGEDDSTGYRVVQANLANVFSPPFITATIYSNRPRLTWPAVPAAGSYRIYRKVPPYTWEWEQYASTTGTSYTDWTTQVTSFYGYSSQPGGGATWVSYYVVAVSTNGLESQLHDRYATYIPNGIPPY